MIAVFGGTFDPVHLGHRHLATAALASYDFEKLFFVPNRQNPLKTDSTRATGPQRVEMIRLLVNAWDNPRVEVWDEEVNRPEPSYAVVTVEKIRSQTGRPVCFLLGDEVYQSLARWHEVRHLLRICSFVVVNRQGDAVGELSTPFQELGLDDWKWDDERIVYGNQWVERLSLSPLPFSSSSIRETLAQADRSGAAPDGLHQQVWEYIKENGLYHR